jgi:hypothetical protein
VIDATASNRIEFLFRDKGFFNLAKSVYLEKYEPFFTLKTVVCRTYSFEN